MNKLKVLFLTLVSLAVVGMPAVAYAADPTKADIKTGLCAGAQLNASSSAGDCSSSEVTGAQDTVTKIIATVINILSVVVGAISVVMIIIGGLKYITSGGDSGNVSGAKNTILYAVVGLVVVALAQIIVKFVLGRLNSSIQ